MWCSVVLGTIVSIHAEERALRIWTSVEHCVETQSPFRRIGAGGGYGERTSGGNRKIARFADMLRAILITERFQEGPPNRPEARERG